MTAAIQLQSDLGQSKSVLIVARDWPSDESIQYTSPWAGAHGRPMPVETPLDSEHEECSRVTYKVMLDQANEDPGCGIKFIDGYDFLVKPSDGYLKLKGGYANVEGFRLLDKNEFIDDEITFGAKYRTWCLNPPVYCAYLLRKFRIKGGITKRRTLMSIEEAFSLAPSVEVVVNCSGFGFGDPLVYPVRGRLIFQTL